jgi:hypothetical protein
MWPREVFDRFVPVPRQKEGTLAGEDIRHSHKTGGVCSLSRWGSLLHRKGYKNAQPTLDPRGRYYNLWNFFSFFVVEDPGQRDEIEGILIAAMPTANGARPNLPKEQLGEEIKTMLREIRQFQANPSSKKGT